MRHLFEYNTDQVTARMLLGGYDEVDVKRAMTMLLKEYGIGGLQKPWWFERCRGSLRLLLADG